MFCFFFTLVYFLELQLHWCANFPASESPSSHLNLFCETNTAARSTQAQNGGGRMKPGIISSHCGLSSFPNFNLTIRQLDVERLIILYLWTLCQYLHLISFCLVCFVSFQAAELSHTRPNETSFGLQRCYTAQHQLHTCVKIQ